MTETIITDNCISKDKAISLVKEYWKRIESIHKDIPKEQTAIYLDILATLKAIEPVRAVEKTGYWIKTSTGKYKCSVCERETTVEECMGEPMFTYCPYCGARVSEELATQAEWERMWQLIGKALQEEDKEV